MPRANTLPQAEMLHQTSPKVTLVAEEEIRWPMFL